MYTLKNIENYRCLTFPSPHILLSTRRHCLQAPPSARCLPHHTCRVGHRRRAPSARVAPATVLISRSEGKPTPDDLPCPLLHAASPRREFIVAATLQFSCPGPAEALMPAPIAPDYGTAAHLTWLSLKSSEVSWINNSTGHGDQIQFG